MESDSTIEARIAGAARRTLAAMMGEDLDATSNGSYANLTGLERRKDGAGRVFIKASKWAQAHGLGAPSVGRAGVWSFTKNGRSVVIPLGSSIVVNGTVKNVAAPAALRNGEVWLSPSVIDAAL